jgi:hypothetical protein
MATDFVPLSNAASPSGPPNRANFRVSVLPGAANTEAFRPLQPGPGTAAHASSQAGPAATSGKPIITLQREGDRVTQIRIECVCGEIILLDCQY